MGMDDRPVKKGDRYFKMFACNKKNPTEDIPKTSVSTNICDANYTPITTICSCTTRSGKSFSGTSSAGWIRCGRIASRNFRRKLSGFVLTGWFPWPFSASRNTNNFLLWHAFAVFEEPASAPAARSTVQVWPRKRAVSVVTSPRW